MIPADIVRMTFKDVDPTLQAERIKLAKEAQSQLRYTRLAKAIALPGALLYNLHKLNIEPLQTEQVNDYMETKKKVGLWGSQKKAILLLFISLAFFGMFLKTLSFGWSDGRGSATVAGALGTLSLVIFALLATLGLFGLWSSHGDRTKQDWVRVNLADYKSNVPEHALAAAIAIDKAVPGAYFQVIYLAETSEHRERPKPDPFLVVGSAHTCEEYYLYAWDEEAEYKF